MSVASKFKERKEAYYEKEIIGLSAFMNIWMPIICITAIWGLVNTAIHSPSKTMTLVLSVIYIVLASTETFLVRGLDKTSFWFTLAFLAIFLVRYVYNMVTALRALAVFSGLFNGTTKNFGDTLSIDVSIGMSFINLIIELAVILFFVGYYTFLFIKHRDFFFLSPKQLLARFDGDD